MRWVFLAVIRLELSGNGWERIGVSWVDLIHYLHKNYCLFIETMLYKLPHQFTTLFQHFFGAVRHISI